MSITNFLESQKPIRIRSGWKTIYRGLNYERITFPWA